MPIQLTELEYLRLDRAQVRCDALMRQGVEIAAQLRQARAAVEQSLDALGKKYRFDPKATYRGDERTFRLHLIDAPTAGQAAPQPSRGKKKTKK